MDRRIVLLIGLLMSLAGPRRAVAQAMLVDDIIILSKGKQQQEKARTESHLGKLPGSGVTPFRFRPGLGQAGRLEERPGPGAPAFPSAMRTPQPFTRGPTGILSAASGYASGGPSPTRATEGPLESPLAWPEGSLVRGAGVARPRGRRTAEWTDPGSGHRPPGPGQSGSGHQIPKARADTLSAGLRGNPMVFASADNVPYGSYSPQRPAITATPSS